MKAIQLNKGFVTIVDDEDYEYLSQWKWYATNQGRVQREWRKDGKTHRMLMHRQLMNAQPGQLIDHINQNPLDNRRANLRFATASQNNQNRKPANKSGLKGVYWCKKRNKYMGYIWVNRKSIYLGISDDPNEIAIMYNEAALKHFGPQAYLNP